jgi:hypothetical protein
MQSRLLLIAITLTMVTTVIASSCARPEQPAQEPEFVLISTKTESTLSLAWPGITPSGSVTSYPEECSLNDPEKVFITVTFWIRPATDNKTVDVKDIVLIVGESDRFYPVGLRTGQGLWDYIFTSGTIHLEFVSDNPNQVGLTLEAQCNSTNDYNIKVKLLEGRYLKYSGTPTISMEDPSLTIAYVVKQSSISSGRLRLQLPGSKPIALTLADKE